MKSLLPLFTIALMILLSACGASKELTAEVAATKSSLDQCQTELTTAQRDLAQAKSMLGGTGDQLGQLQSENQALRNQLTDTQAQLASMTQQMQASSDNHGVWYRVQIGAFGERKVDGKLETTDQLSLETKNDVQKTALGRFRNYDDAKKLQAHLQSIGLKDAWIVSYKDGVRVAIEEIKN